MDIPFWQLVLVSTLVAFLGRFWSRRKRKHNKFKEDSWE